MAAFLVIETRVREPMLPLHLFKKPAFTGVQLAALSVSASMFALFLYLTLYLQGYLGHDPIEAGLRYLPVTVVNFFVAAGTGALLSRVQARVLISAGLAITGLGLLLMGGIDPTDDWTGLLAGFLLAGAGVGLINPAIADVAVSVVPKEQSGMASGINDTFRQVGIAIGIAAWGAIFLGRGAAKVEQLAAGTPAATGERPRQLVEAVSSGNLDSALANVPPGSRSGVADAARSGFLSGINEILMLGGIIAVTGALFALWLIRERDIERDAVVEVEPAYEPRPGEALPEPVAA
jgi:Major Facilitator Superfamily